MISNAVRRQSPPCAYLKLARADGNDSFVSGVGDQNSRVDFCFFGCNEGHAAKARK